MARHTAGMEPGDMALPEQVKAGKHSRATQDQNRRHAAVRIAPVSIRTHRPFD